MRSTTARPGSAGDAGNDESCQLRQTTLRPSERGAVCAHHRSGAVRSSRLDTISKISKLLPHLIELLRHRFHFPALVGSIGFALLLLPVRCHFFVPSLLLCQLSLYLRLSSLLLLQLRLHLRILTLLFCTRPYFRLRCCNLQTDFLNVYCDAVAEFVSRRFILHFLTETFDNTGKRSSVRLVFVETLPQQVFSIGRCLRLNLTFKRALVRCIPVPGYLGE